MTPCYYDLEEDERPELEAPRCRYCGHEITTIPVIRLFDDQDPDAQWNICPDCLSRKPVMHESRVRPG